VKNREDRCRAAFWWCPQSETWSYCLHWALYGGQRLLSQMSCPLTSAGLMVSAAFLKSRCSGDWGSPLPQYLTCNS